LRLDKRVVALLVGRGGVDGYGQSVEVGYERMQDCEYLGDKEVYAWLLRRLTLGTGPEKEKEVEREREKEGVEGGNSIVSVASSTTSKARWGAAMKKTVKNVLSVAELAKKRELQKTEGLGELRFSHSQGKGAVRISGHVMVMEVVQEKPVRAVAGPGKVVTQEEIEDEEFPPMVVRCGDPTTSAVYTFRMTQRVLRGLECMKKERKEELLAAERRPQLANWLLKRAGRILVLSEKGGRVQLCIAGESGEEMLQARLDSRVKTLEKMALVKKAQEARKRKIQNECRVVRLEEFRVAAAKKRERMERKMLIAQIKEWQGMHMEDVASNSIRSYLCCDESLLSEVRIAFEVFDGDGSGDISSSEFQALCFELGEIMDETQTKEALRVIDLDGNGVIQFHEFATWWVTDKPSGAGDKDDVNHKMLALKLKMLKRAKTVYGRLGFAGGAFGGKGAGGGGSRGKISTPLAVTREGEGEGGGGLLGGWFGKKKKAGGGRPGTV
jgi:hypothetical protein